MSSGINSFSRRLSLKIVQFFSLFVIVTGLLVGTYISYSISREVNLTQNALQRLLHDEVKRIFNYGETIQLQPMLSSAVRIADDNFSTYIILQAKRNGKVLAYAGDISATNNFLKRVVKLEIEAPVYGVVETETTIGFDKNASTLVLVFVSAICLFSGTAIYIIRLLQATISSQSVGIDELEKVLLSNGGVSDEMKFSKAANMIRSYAETRANLESAEKTALFAKQVAHDIRSPLSALSLAISSLQDLPAEQKRLINNAATRISDIAHDLLEKGKISSQNPVAGKNSQSAEPDEFQNEPLSLIPLVEAILSEKRFGLVKTNISIEANFDKNLTILIQASGKELQRLLSNLINNSIEATQENLGVILVAIREYEKVIELTVRDNGKGIAPEILSQLGQPGISYGKESGSGLGIYGAKNYIEAIGGKFSIISQVGSGTIVRMQLPKYYPHLA